MHRSFFFIFFLQKWSSYSIYLIMLLELLSFHFLYSRKIQGDHLYMSVCQWQYSSVHWTGQFFTRCQKTLVALYRIQEDPAIRILINPLKTISRSSESFVNLIENLIPSSTLPGLLKNDYNLYFLTFKWWI